MATDSITIINAVFPANAKRLALANNANAQKVQAEISAGFIGMYSGDPSLPGYGAGDCAKAGGYTPQGLAISSETAKITSTATSAGSLLSKIIPALAPVPVIGQVVAGIAGLVTTVLGVFGAHHTAAVAKEQGTLCALIPQVNQTIRQVDADVAAGNIDVVTADQELESLYSNFVSATAGITQDSGNTCNAGCVTRATVRAVIDEHEQGYHNAPIYYVKKYWWVGAIAFMIYVLWRLD